MKRSRREPGPGGFQRLVAIRSRLSRCSTKRASFNGDAKHMAGDLLKHSRSLHLETLYRLYFFRYTIYNKCRKRERDSKGREKRLSFHKRKNGRKENGSSASCVYVIRESSLSLSLAHDKSIYFNCSRN